MAVVFARNNTDGDAVFPFALIYGLTFFDYIAHWRVEASKPLVLAGELTILDTSLEVGFNTRSTFYRAFKRETVCLQMNFARRPSAQHA